jgi:hypothetical protein
MQQAAGGQGGVHLLHLVVGHASTTQPAARPDGVLIVPITHQAQALCTRLVPVN